jgi:hypothetical protein
VLVGGIDDVSFYTIAMCQFAGVLICLSCDLDGSTLLDCGVNKYVLRVRIEAFNMGAWYVVIEHVILFKVPHTSLV